MGAPLVYNRLVDRLHFNPRVSAPVHFRPSWMERLVARAAAMFRRRAAEPAESRLALGRRGESLACRYLRRQGYRIVDRNPVFRLGGHRWMEFDIIAEDAGALVFVEVKTRRRHMAAFPAERAVHPGKRRRLARGARAYRQARQWRGPYRFDVLCIYDPDGPAPEVHLMRDAFFPGRR
ncbi:MAG: YraN family protein [Terriglobales bacterium]